MQYRIEPAYKGGEYTPAQRSHSLFAEEPRVGPFQLRRGDVLILEESQMAAISMEAKLLVDAGAITVTPIGVPTEASPAAARAAEEKAAAELEAKLKEAEQQALAELAEQEAAQKAIDETGEPAVLPEPGAAHEAAVAVAEEAVQAQEAEAAPAEPAPAPVTEAPRSTSKKRR